MIPKIIHYCWFGSNKMSKLSLLCLSSWEKYLPTYKCMLWNETNFDIYSNPYVKEAYESNKYAFVTDYVRLYVLHKYGGIYMDTDVEVLKPLDTFLDLPAFSGFETTTHVPTGIIGSEKGGVWAKEMLEYYDNRHFILPDGSMDMTSNVQIISNLMNHRSGYIPNNTYQIYNNCFHIFPKEYFCPKRKSGSIVLTNNSFCIHHFEGSWNTRPVKFKKFITRDILGPYLTEKMVRLKRWICGQEPNPDL